MRFAFGSTVDTLARAFAAAGLPLYAVGGCVRGALMGLPAADYDLCGPATVEEVVSALTGICDVQPTQVYGRMGTMRLVVGDGYAEYTAFRTERYGRGHTPTEVRFTRSLQEDAFRRDFTCNALYVDLQRGQLVDEVGGAADISARLLRATTPDPRIILRDDGLRVLRMVRFAAQLRFAVEGDTWAAADAELLRDIAAERQADELRLILLSDTRYALAGGKEALSQALRQLRELGVWAVLFPQLSLDEALCVAAPPELPLRLAALLWPSGPTAVEGALQRLRFPHTLCRQVAQMAEALSNEVPDDPTLLRHGYAFANAWATLRPALLPRVEALRKAKAPASLRELALSGDEVTRALGGPSPLVGRALEALRCYAVTHPSCNLRRSLLQYLEKWKESAV